jgi:type VI protein secretion system component Hcp
MDTGVGSVQLYMKVGSGGSLTKESHTTSWKDKGYTDIQAFSLGSSASWNFASGQSAGGSANISDITVSRAVMASTVLLFMGCAKEKYTDQVEIICVDTTGKEILFAVRLKGEVRLTSCAIGGATGGAMTESTSWTGKILEIEHTKSSKKEHFDWSNVEQKGDELK